MNIEIERKFLTLNDSWKMLDTARPSQRIVQGYLQPTGPSVRVRTATSDDGEQAWITVKGKAEGISRKEFEYAIPFEDAQALLALSQHTLIEKTRFFREGPDSKVWEIDVFEGVNEGLVVAEIELESEDETFVTPDWLGKEVTTDPRYTNSALAENPFSTWAKRVEFELV